ncbi:hypothetical protein [Sphingobium yanoikuyae]|uniref:hypothetical protein n=1 Tax=Sphingobium yanoikuyae TaxID=13690 RepID=UPI0026F12999|nr:hypothetical protein [Sphingobium yanoikuyae]
MGAVVTAFNTAFRDYVAAGIPASGENDPAKSEIRAIGETIEQLLVTSGIQSIYETTSAGIAATTNGQLFIVAGSGDVFAYLYKNVAGVAVYQGVSLPSSASVEALQDALVEIQGVVGDVAVLKEAAGYPSIYPVPGWEKIELDADGRFSSGRKTDNTEWAAKNHAEAQLEERPWRFPFPIADWVSVTVDPNNKFEAGVDRWGIYWVGYRGEIVPVGNGGLILSACAYGDSTTYGDELTARNAERWTTLLGADLGIPIWNRGANGQSAAKIVARAGGYISTASVTGGSIPASGPVTLTDSSVPDMLSSYTYDGLWDVMTDDGTRIRGTLTRASGTAYTFTRLNAGSAKAAAIVDLIPITGRNDLAAHAFIGMGINDEPATGANTSLDDMKAHYRAITSACKGGFTVWGVLDRGAGEPTANMAFILALETWLRQEYGSAYCPVRPYLASARALADAALVAPGFTPTTDDTDAVAAGRTPPSFRFGGVHLNELGHQLQARFMSRFLRARSPNTGSPQASFLLMEGSGRIILEN